MLSDGTPMVSALVGECTCRTEHLDYGNETKKQENNPYHFVTLEQVFYQVHYCLFIGFLHTF